MKREYTVCAMIIDPGSRILLVHHATHQKWLPPGGHVEENELFDDAVAREVREETGLTAVSPIHSIKAGNSGRRKLLTPDHVEVHAVHHGVHGEHEHVNFSYYCTTIDTALVLNENEHTEIRWLTLEEVQERAHGSVYTRSRQALQRAERRLHGSQ